MNNTNDKQKRNGGGFTAGLVMGAVGAAAGAAAVALSDKGNQRKLEKTLDSLKEKGEQFRASAMKKLDRAEGEVDEKMKLAKGALGKTKRKVAAVKRAAK